MSALTKQYLSAAACLPSGIRVVLEMCKEARGRPSVEWRVEA